MNNDTNEAKATLESQILAKVRKYYFMGLTAKETGKLLDTSPRTVQRYIKEGNYKTEPATKSIEQKAFDLSKQGLSYTQIAKKMKCSKTTVYTHIKRVRLLGSNSL